MGICRCAVQAPGSIVQEEQEQVIKLSKEEVLAVCKEASFLWDGVGAAANDNVGGVVHMLAEALVEKLMREWTRSRAKKPQQTRSRARPPHKSAQRKSRSRNSLLKNK